MPNRKSDVRPRMTFGSHGLLAFFGGIALWLHPWPAAADTLFSNLGLPPDVYGNTGYVIAGNNVPNTAQDEVASLFAVNGVANVSYSLTQVDLAVAYDSGVNSFTVFLAADNNGVPGAVVPNTTVPFNATVNGCCATLRRILYITPTLMGQGQYFMVVAAGDPTASGTWALNDQGFMSPFVLHSGNGGVNWTGPPSGSAIAMPAFDVIGNAPSSVPEPSSLALLAIALFGVFFAWRRLRMRPNDRLT